MLEANIVALITPFTKNLKINYPKLKELIEYQIQSNVNGIVLLGTTAEASSLTAKEQIKLIKYAIKVINKRVKIIVGCSAINTLDCIKKVKKYSNYLIDYFLVLTPFYLKTNQEGLIKHFTLIADNSKKPIIIYHVPSRTGQKIEIESIKLLAKHKNIYGIKEASGSLDYLLKLKKYITDDFKLYGGNDELMIEVMENNGSGIISVFSNSHPKITSQIMNLCLTNNFKEAKNIFKKYQDYIKLLFIEPNPIPIKEAMNYLEFDVGDYRLPLTNMSKNNKRVLINEIEVISR